ncbi:MAG: hypothetical protein E1N59_3081 [Puniceicoccaceae bacterium 5H]|nr:MAG: hypothetical protein E1N59_3081 [Puniceicoccaceae bacterium 5H]
MASKGLKILWVTGTWQYILLRAALAQHGERVTPEEWVVIVSGGRSTDAFLQRLVDLSVQAFPGVEVLELRHQEFWQHATYAFFVNLQQRRGARIEAIWSCFPTEQQSRALHIIQPQCQNWAVEDGLVTYAPSFSTLPRFTPSANQVWAARQLGPLLSSSGLQPLLRLTGPLGRRLIRWIQFRNPLPVTGYYGLLNDLLPDYTRHLPQHQIQTDVLQAEVDAYRELLGYTPPVFERPTILFLGDNLHSIMGDKAEEVFELTLDWLQHVLDLGYDVYWKPHPRAAAHLSERLDARFQGQRFYRAPDIDMAPAEVAYAVPSLSGVISMLSSACFYFPRFFGIPSYRFPFPREEIELTRQLEEVLDLSEAHIPEISRLPAAHAAQRTDRAPS